MQNERQESQTLTVREIECLAALAEGLNREGIARKLNIAVPTVAMHLANACRKLAAATREQAVAVAMRRGILR